MESHRWCCRSNGSSCCSVCRALSLWSEDTPSHLQAGGAGKPSSPEYCSHCMAEDGTRSWLNHQYRLSTCTHDKQKPLLMSNTNTVPAPHLNVMCSLLPCDVEFEALHEKNNVCTPTPRSLFVNFAGGWWRYGIQLKSEHASLVWEHKHREEIRWLVEFLWFLVSSNSPPNICLFSCYYHIFPDKVPV